MSKSDSLRLYSATPKNNTKRQLLSLLGAGGFVTGILGISAIYYWLTPHIIRVDFNDVSKSAQEYKFPDPKQTYQSLLEQHCRDNIELLREGDVLIFGKYAAAATVTQNTTFYNSQKSVLLKDCQQAATVPPRLPNKNGTSFPLALERIQTEITSLRTKGIAYPVAVTLVIDAAEPGPDQPQLSFEALKATIQKMVKDEKVFLAFIGPDVELQNQLAETLANVPNTRVCTFAEHKVCTEWVVETARSLKGKSSK